MHPVREENAMRRKLPAIIGSPRLTVVVAGAVGVLLSAAGGGPLVLAASTVTLNVAMSQTIYQPFDPVKADITITNGQQLKGLLRVQTFDEQTGAPINSREYPLTLPADGSRVVPSVIATTPAPDASYSVVAAFYVDNQATPVVDGRARFGVRPPNFPSGVPDHILKAEVPSLNVPDILERLEQGAQGRKPVQLTIGSQAVTVQVERLEVLAPGVEIPGLGRRWQSGVVQLERSAGLGLRYGWLHRRVSLCASRRERRDL
jgi:hypothetical protein